MIRHKTKKHPFVWTYAAVALAVALASYVYLGRTGEETYPPVLLALDGTTVDQVAIDRGEDRFALRREDGEWTLFDGDCKFDTDILTVSRILSALSDLEAVREVASDAKGPDMDRYGLSTPSLVVIAGAGDSQIKISFGDKTPVGHERYAMASSRPGAIYTVAGSHFDTLDQERDDIRERRVVTVAAARLAEISIANSKQTIRAVKSDGEWTMTSPYEDRADDYVISDLGWTASGLKADEFVDDDPASLSPYGLDPPRATAIFTSESEEPNGEPALLTVYIGSSAEDGSGFYFMTDKSRSVYRSNQHTPPFVDLEANDLLQTSIVVGTRADLVEFDAFIGGQHYAVEAEDDQWNVKLPSGEAISLSGSEVLNAWYKLLQVKVDGIAPDEYQGLSDEALGIAHGETGIGIEWTDGSETTALYGNVLDLGKVDEAPLVLCRISDRKHVYIGDPADLQALIEAISGSTEAQQ